MNVSQQLINTMYRNTSAKLTTKNQRCQKDFQEILDNEQKFCHL